MSALAGKVALARAAGAVARRRGHGGTSLPGRVLLRAEPGAIALLGARLPQGSVVISATNGKTTTSAMLASILARRGTTLVHNRAGANMEGGVASALLAAWRRGGRIDGELGLFEVDEFWLDRVAAALAPRVITLGNLFRDQLDRYGELETIAQRWRALVGTEACRETILVLNADDPLVADLGDGAQVAPLYFGVEDDGVALPDGLAHASDAKHCRNCGAPYRFDAVYLGHLGRWHCESCGHSRPQPAVAAGDVRLDGLRGARFTLRTPAGATDVSLPLPGLYNVYNAIAAAASALALGVDLESVAAGLEAVRPAFGRAELVPVDGRSLRILLVKNPAGANEVLRTLSLEDGEHDALAILNDRTADGQDVSWVWDADFETIAGRLRRVTCAGTRAAELALRLKYAGVPPQRIAIEPDVARALHGAVEATPAGATLYALPTYTGMLELRAVLSSNGLARGSWDR